MVWFRPPAAHPAAHPAVYWPLIMTTPLPHACEQSHIGWSAQDLRRLLLCLLGLELALVLIYGVDHALGAPLWSVHRLFDLDAESSVPAWFSSTQLFVIGMVLLLRGRQASRAAGQSGVFLVCLGLGFTMLSIDESAAVHEMVNEALKARAQMPRFKDGQGIWISAYAALGLGLVLLCFRPMLQLWRSHPRAVQLGCVGFALLLAGAVGLEIFSYEHLRGGATPGWYAVEVAAEEFLEMAGASVVLYASLLLFADGASVSESSELPMTAPEVHRA